MMHCNGPSTAGADSKLSLDQLRHGFVVPLPLPVYIPDDRLQGDPTAHGQQDEPVAV